MNSLVRYVLENGGKDYNLIYPNSLISGSFCSCNPSCVWYKDNLVVNSRLVNYKKIFQNEDVNYIGNLINQTYLFYDSGFESKNVVGYLNDGKLYDIKENKYGNSDCESFYSGFEDCRLVVWKNHIYAYGTRWDKVENEGRICIYKLNENLMPTKEIVVESPTNSQCEKNWGAVEDQPFTFVYRTNPTKVIKVLSNGKTEVIKEDKLPIKNLEETIKGSTPLVRYDENCYITIVHKSEYVNGNNGIDCLNYYSAFAFYDNDLNLTRISNWFIFKNKMCEFSCGLTVKGNDVYIGYSQFDCMSYILKTNKQTINNFINIKCDFNDAYTFEETYNIAKIYNVNRYKMASCVLYNYASLLAYEEVVDDEYKIECKIRTFGSIINELQSISNREYFHKILTQIEITIDEFPYVCEFYYLASYVCKLIGNYDEYFEYKKHGDKLKSKMHNYFFEYLNPNYL